MHTTKYTREMPLAVFFEIKSYVLLLLILYNLRASHENANFEAWENTVSIQRDAIEMRIVPAFLYFDLNPTRIRILSWHGILTLGSG